MLIVGGGLASARAIKSYREAGGDGSIGLVSKDSTLPYHRPPLSKKFLRGEIAHRVNLKFAPDLRFRIDERFDEAERIEKLLRTPAVQRDLAPDSDDK